LLFNAVFIVFYKGTLHYLGKVTYTSNSSVGRKLYVTYMYALKCNVK